MVGAQADGAAGSQLRVALVGVGFWGRTWVEVVRSSPRCELVALVDADPDALARAGDAAAVPRESRFASIGEAAVAAAPDAALVVVPPAAHAAVALEALDAGLHCLIEKPLAHTLADARLIVERAAAAGRVAMVSQQYRYRAGAVTVRRLVREGAVGAVGAAVVRFADVLPVRGFQHELDEPLLRDMAIHHFDLVRAVLGLEPNRVLAASHNPPWSDYAGNAAATAVLDAPGGATVSYAGTWAPRGVTTGWDGAWEILGDRGTILWNGDDVRVRPLETPRLARLRRRALGREWSGRKMSPERVAFPDRGGSLAELAAAVREGREPETSARDNLRSLALTLAAVESVRRGAAVGVEELLGPDG